MTWQEMDGYLALTTPDWHITIQNRPSYCDRGTHVVLVEPRSQSARFDFDHADAFPRYYFGLDVAKQQMEAWLPKRSKKGDLHGLR